MLGHTDEKNPIHNKEIFIAYAYSLLLVSPSKLIFSLYLLGSNAKTTTSTLRLATVKLYQTVNLGKSSTHCFGSASTYLSKIHKYI